MSALLKELFHLAELGRIWLGPNDKSNEMGRAKRLERKRLALEALEDRTAPSVNGLLPFYDTGTPAVVDIWVDPVRGHDANPGVSRSQALKTVSEAWRRIPASAELQVGYRVNLTQGDYSQDSVPNYWENRWGTKLAPVILRSVDGAGASRLPAINMYDCRHVHMIGLDVSASGGDVLHLEKCDHVLVREVSLRGLGDIHAYASPQETLKANQCRNIFVEKCDISGAFDNAVDFVGVQYGHVLGNRIHRAGDWAIYAKGGSAYLTISGNEIFDAGTGGFTAGQGTGSEFMVSPWIHYEAYDIKFTNNIIHDAQGAGIGINGGYNILAANNTMYRVGARSHVIEIGLGSRSCDGDQQKCSEFLAMGGWGTATVEREEPIPNNHVFIFNNIVLNPEGYSSRWQHLALSEPRQADSTSNIPFPVRADQNLRIEGNIIWNGNSGMPLGIESEELASDILLRNSINLVKPILMDPDHGDFRLHASFEPPPSVQVPDFDWLDAPKTPAPPPGRSDNFVMFDFSGNPRGEGSRVGAFATAGEIPDLTNLTVAISGLPEVVVGQSVVVRVTVVNLSRIAVSNTVVSIGPIGSTLGIRGLSASLGTANLAARSVSWSVGFLDAGATATLTIGITPRAAVSFRLFASGATMGRDIDPSDNEAYSDLRVVPKTVNAIVVTGAGTGAGGLVRVHDAQTVQLKTIIFPYGRSFRGGVRVASADVTGDGWADVITAPGPGASPMIRVFNGRTGLAEAGPLGRMMAFPQSMRAGVHVSAGDMDGDGRAEIVVGTDSGPICETRIYSGASGHLMRSMKPFAGFRGGVLVSVGDTNGDGLFEVIVSQPSGAASITKAFSPLTGQQLWSISVASPSSRSPGILAVGDWDADGRDDVMVNRGRVQAVIISGKDKSLIETINIGAMYSISMVDLNGDGLPDTAGTSAWGGFLRLVVGFRGGMSPEIPLGNSSIGAFIAVGRNPAFV